MSVIGRLDDQVNEIIIKPVSERREGHQEETETPAQESTRVPQSRTEERVKGEASAKHEESELPVWLL